MFWLKKDKFYVTALRKYVEYIQLEQGFILWKEVNCGCNYF